MNLDVSQDVVFIGRGATAPMWYRCALPAIFMGADWVGVYGEPGATVWKTGSVRGESHFPKLREYQIVVVQQVMGRRWEEVIRKLRADGHTVLYEIDDYLHGIYRKPRGKDLKGVPKGERKGVVEGMQDHDFWKAFTPERLAEYERCMKVCDALICSTDYIARRYRRFNEQTYVCENGLDTRRYRLTLPERTTVNMGWAGATGHRRSVIPWLRQVALAMQEYPETAFISIGQAFARGFVEAFGEGRAIATPFTSIETYPAAMTNMDIAIAPAGPHLFFRGKSDLRWLEAGALGIPIIADPVVYPKITHGVDGFHAESPAEALPILRELIADRDLRVRVGQAAKGYVQAERSMEVAVEQWFSVFADVLGGTVSHETPPRP